MAKHANSPLSRRTSPKTPALTRMMSVTRLPQISQENPYSREKTLSSIAQDPNTFTFIYSKAVNRALRRLADAKDDGDLVFHGSEVKIDRLPEIYESLVFMNQTCPPQSRAGCRGAARRQRSTMTRSVSHLTTSDTSSIQRQVSMTDRGPQAVRLPPITQRHLG